MKKLFLLLFILSTTQYFLIGQTNNYPTTGDVTIYNYSPSLILQRNTADGGFTEGIQTRLQDGTDNWFFGALLTGQWIVSKGNHSNPKMTILDNGNVGIGTSSPQYKLDVSGDGRIGNLSSRHYLKVTSPEWSEIRFETPSSNEKIRIGVAHEDNSSYHVQEGDLYFYTMDIDAMPFILKKGGNVLLNTTSGNVGIGTQSPDQKLTVKGKIHAEEVIVDLNVPVADYVFKPTYKLMPLHEVEQFVKTNSHLPEIPSATEITKNGLSMGEMQNKLLQKVEELTLYMISQQKTIDQQQAQIKELNNKLSKLDKQ